jgi:membrane AbrB-like protein
VKLIAVLAGATVVGAVAQHFDLPGGLMVGAMVGAAAVNLSLSADAHIPKALDNAALVVIGASIGLLINSDTMRSLQKYFFPAVLAGVLIIVAGIGISLLLRTLGMAPPGDVLATSPGALANLAAAAREQQGAVEVAMFHTIRLVMVILSIPVVSKLLRHV